MQHLPYKHWAGYVDGHSAEHLHRCIPQHLRREVMDLKLGAVASLYTGSDRGGCKEEGRQGHKCPLRSMCMDVSKEVDLRWESLGDIVVTALLCA